jgi:AcrR family transcriptional regulator
MKPKSDATKESILAVARQEFLARGFRDASLRQIAKKANGTTGIIYTYFKNKNDLFETLVRPVILEFERRLATEEPSMDEAFEQKGMRPKDWFTKNLKFLIGLVETYPNEMRLLFLKAQGSAYENYKDELIQEGTRRSVVIFRTLKRKASFNDQQLSEFFVLNLVQYVINVVVEMMKQDTLPDQIARYEREITTFLFNGWKGLVDI